METKEYRSVDKSGWARGEWADEATGLPCLIVRGPSGALCGYVGVPDTHPWHSKEYGAAIGECNEDCDGDYHYGHRIDSQISVHGGLTFSDACQHSAEDRGICHVPGLGEPDNIWWFGFDCAHSVDTCPKHIRELGRDGTYKSVNYVRREVTDLARQIAAVKS